MPFQSEAQRRYLHANEPEIAQRWEREEDMAYDKKPMAGSYPGVENFNAGGEDAEILRTIEGEGVHRLNGPNAITDSGDPEDDYGPLDVGESFD